MVRQVFQESPILPRRKAAGKYIRTHFFVPDQGGTEPTRRDTARDTSFGFPRHFLQSSTILLGSAPIGPFKNRTRMTNTAQPRNPNDTLGQEATAPAASAEVRRVTLWGLATNLGLAAVKFLFGFLGHSQALVADAVHSLSDSITDIVVLIGVSYWNAPADEQHPYGHARIETMITATIGILLGAVGIGIGYYAIAGINEKDVIQPGWIALAAACLSIVVKEALYQWTIYVGRRVRSSALLANAWHHRSDALSSMPVAVAVLGTRLWPSWGFLDHIAAVIVCVLILHAAWKIAWPAVRQLSDVGAADEQRRAILKMAMETEGVRSVHALRTRYLGPGLQIDLHVLVDPDLTVREGHDIAGAVKRRLLAEGPEVLDVLVHVEPFPEAQAEPHASETEPRP